MASNNDKSVQVPDLLDKKFTAIFNWFDQNGDGCITQDDMEKTSEKFCSIADENDQKNRSSIDIGLMHWYQLLLDAREDRASKKIEQREFSRIMHTVVTAPEHFEAAVLSLVDGALGALDRDGSGTLSEDEYTRLYESV